MMFLADLEDEVWIIVISLIIYFILGHVSRLKGRKYPSGPYGLPILGYLPFLTPTPHLELSRLKDIYGGVFSLYLGRTYVVILGDYEAVKDAFSKSTTLDRPEHLFDFLPDGVGFSGVNGEEWVEQRRYSVRTMRDSGLGKGPWESLIRVEVQDFVKIIRRYEGRPMDVCSLLTSSVSNNIASLLFGKRFEMDDPNRIFLNSSIDAVSQFFGQAGLASYFPRLADLFTKFGLYEYDRYKAKLKAFNEFIRKEVEKNKSQLKDISENFISSYLSEMKTKQDRNEESTFNERNLCGNVQGLLVGGSDTTRTSLNWLLIAMAQFPDIQKRVQQELDSTFGDGCIASWNDRSRIPYTYAVIMEGQRWKTIAPLNTARIAQEDIKICGYDIPKGATIIANNWGLHNDTKYWSDPEEFQPERFLNDDGTVNSKIESYVPFSFGKRNCPGDVVALMEILLYFSALMSHFNVTSGEPDERPKLEAALGITYQAIPQKMCLIPRY